VRNFLRCLGGSVGLAVSAAVLQNVLRKELPADFKYLARTTYSKPDYSKFSAEDGELILDAYAKASRAVFIFMAPCAAICLITCVFVKDRGLTRAEDMVKSETASVAKDEEKAVGVDERREGSVRSVESEKKAEIEAEKVLEVGVVKSV
jgi:hypothetical protein